MTLFPNELKKRGRRIGEDFGKGMGIRGTCISVSDGI